MFLNSTVPYQLVLLKSHPVHTFKHIITRSSVSECVLRFRGIKIPSPNRLDIITYRQAAGVCWPRDSIKHYFYYLLRLPSYRCFPIPSSTQAPRYDIWSNNPAHTRHVTTSHRVCAAKCGMVNYGGFPFSWATSANLVEVDVCVNRSLWISMWSDANRICTFHPFVAHRAGPPCREQ